MSRNYVIHFTICIAFAVVGLFVISLIAPESPEFLVARGDLDDYEEARRGLTYVAHFNGVKKVNGIPYENFKFVVEKKLME